MSQPRWVIVDEYETVRTEQIIGLSRVDRVLLRLPWAWRRVWRKAALYGPELGPPVPGETP